MTEVTTVKCPTCQKPVIWNEESKYRPFCSQRCRLIDLGEWAQEKYTVATEEDLQLIGFIEIINDEA